MKNQNSKVAKKILIAGLGNPGKKYEKTRHNAGFLAADFLRKHFELPAWKLSKKHNAFVSIGEINGKKIILAKPQTCMNSSGSAVRSLMRLYGLGEESLVVLHDDIDIPFGKIKISANSGSAGHHGVESVIEFLGTRNFTRVRVGIQPDQSKPDAVEEFVLQKFSQEELDALQTVFDSLPKKITEIFSDVQAVCQK